MKESNFISNSYTKILENGQFSWQSPSNIALVKYWGKYGEQLPKNASVSFTLSNCNTKTTLSFEVKHARSASGTSESFDFEVYLDEKRETSFEPKILKFFERVEVYLPFLKDYKFKIETGMSALALCLMSMEKSLVDGAMPDTDFNQKASFLARLGSGSACRSIEGDLVVWGEHSDIEGSSKLFGTKYPHLVHENFKNYQDTILLVDKGEKQVSSTIGHDLMHNHPFASERFRQANENLSKLTSIFESGDLSAFIKIVESEALSLHAMMLTSMPYFVLMKPNTLEIINRIWAFRLKSDSKICFTLDAGANVHVLFPESEKKIVSEFIKLELSQFCKNGEFIEDQVGFGAVKI
jgi:diphosphomevalonate decarboxylase